MRCRAWCAAASNVTRASPAPLIRRSGDGPTVTLPSPSFRSDMLNLSDTALYGAPIVLADLVAWRLFGRGRGAMRAVWRCAAFAALTAVLFAHGVAARRSRVGHRPRSRRAPGHLHRVVAAMRDRLQPAARSFAVAARVAQPAALSRHRRGRRVRRGGGRRAGLRARPAVERRRRDVRRGGGDPRSRAAEHAERRILRPC